MAATPSSTAQTKTRGPRKAGVLFGIDLRSLFEDDEQTAGGLEGFMPMTKTTSQLKGRTPTTLTYKQPSQPARTVEEFAAPTQAASIGTPTTETPKPIETPAAPKSLAEMSAQDIFSSYSKYDQGEQGLFGGQDVDYLRGQGVGDDTIR